MAPSTPPLQVATTRHPLARSSCTANWPVPPAAAVTMATLTRGRRRRPEASSSSSPAAADRGCLVVIGMMDQYSTGWSPRSIKGLPEKLLWKSASVRGFFLLRYAPQWGSHLRALSTMAASGALQVAVDGGGDGEGQARFVGIECVADAVDRLQGGRSSGKVVVQLSRELPEQEEERLRARL